MNPRYPESAPLSLRPEKDEAALTDLRGQVFPQVEFRYLDVSLIIDGRMMQEMDRRI